MRKSLRQIIQKQHKRKCANCNGNCLSESSRVFSAPLLDGFQSDEETYLGNTKGKRVKKEMDTIEDTEIEAEGGSMRYIQNPRKRRKTTTVLDAILKVFSEEWKSKSELLNSTIKDKENLILCNECYSCLSELYEPYSRFIQLTQDSERHSYLYPVVCHITPPEYPFQPNINSYEGSTGEERNDLSSLHQVRLVSGSDECKEGQLLSRVITEKNKRHRRQLGLFEPPYINPAPESISPGILKNEPTAVLSDFEYEDCEIQSTNDEGEEEEWQPVKSEVSKPARSCRQRYHKVVGKRGPHRRVKCSQPDCPEVFLYHWRMSNHVQIDHENKKPIKCDKCNFSSFDPDVLESHFCVESTEEKDSSERNLRFRCGFCNQPFSSKSSEIQHSRIHDRSLIQCTFMNCPRTFVRMSQLEKHERVKHGVQEGDASTDIDHAFQCSECGKIFSSKPRFKIHMEIHGPERKYLCNHCGMSFKQRRALMRHELIHKDIAAIRLHNCRLCQKSFKRSYNLTQHIHSKLHQQAVAEKVINGEELHEEDFKNFTLRRTRTVKKRNEKAEDIGSSSVNGKVEVEGSVKMKTGDDGEGSIIIRERQPIYVTSPTLDLFPSSYAE